MAWQRDLRGGEAVKEERGVNVHIQQNKLQVGIKETKSEWGAGWGLVMNITSLDLSVFTGRP